MILPLSERLSLAIERGVKLNFAGARTAGCWRINSAYFFLAFNSHT